MRHPNTTQEEREQFAKWWKANMAFPFSVDVPYCLMIYKAWIYGYKARASLIREVLQKEFDDS